MTIEEVMTLDMEQLETRAGEIAGELETAEDLDGLKAELDAIEERKQVIITEAEEKRAEMDAVIEEAEVVEETKEERKSMNSKEVRNMPEYIDAYVEYMKGNSDGEECRTLLTTNAVIGSDEFGTVPVPTYIEERIQAAWEEDGIMSRVRKTFLRGNVKVGVEMSATGAVMHDEGAAAPDEETLVIATVDLVAKSCKKWITVSDEAMDLRGQAFLDYLYDEIEYQIVKAEAAAVVAAVTGAPTSGTTAPTVSEVNITNAGDIITAIYSAEGMAIGEDLVFVANRGTIADAKITALSMQFPVDPFDGMTVIPCDSLPALADASSNDPVAIVGDLKAIQANFPAGGEVSFKFDDLSLAERDLVKIVGRQMVGIGLTRNKAFAVLTA